MQQHAQQHAQQRRREAAQLVSLALASAYERLAEPAVRDAYERVRALVITRDRRDGVIAHALAAVERNPRAASCRDMADEALRSSLVEPDSELTSAAQALLDTTGHLIDAICGATARLSEPSIADEYVALRERLLAEYDHDGALACVLAELERDPRSAAVRGTVEHALRAAGATHDLALNGESRSLLHTLATTAGSGPDPARASST